MTAAAVNDYDWVTTAMTDDALVVNLLLRLKSSVSLKLHHPLPFAWGLRKPRSRPSRLAPSSRCCDPAVSTRCSPTTPLSWSGGASPSDGCEHSSRHPSARSKATATSGYTGNSASNKKCRRKKTFAELKEEESSLLKERTYLKKEIAHVNANFEAQRVKNESLKRIKLDFDSKSHQKNLRSKSEEQKCRVSDQPLKETITAQDDETHSSSQAAESSLFLIPDLNMPPEDASYALCGTN